MLFIFIVILTLGSLGAFDSRAETAAQSTATATVAPTNAATIDIRQTMDKLVGVGGYRLFVHCTGQGTPAVVMDAGFGNTWDTWNKVQPGVSQFTRVCSYDRAGLGKSESGPTPTTSLQMGKELHTLLTQAPIMGPYVVVGHSFGGMNMRLFGSLFPTEVVGMVLVDSAHEDVYLKYLPYTNLRGVDLKTSAEQGKAAGPFPNIPLIVLRHGDAYKSPSVPVPEEAWLSYQVMLSQLSPQGKLLVAEKSGHFIQDDQPELIVQSIRYIVETVRNGPTAPTQTPFWTPIPTMAATAARTQ